MWGLRPDFGFAKIRSFLPKSQYYGIIRPETVLIKKEVKMSPSNDPSESLRALNALEEAKREWEYLNREKILLENSLSKIDPESDEAKEGWAQVTNMKVRLSAIGRQCQELQAIWKANKSPATKRPIN